MNENIFVGGDAYANELRAATEADRVRKTWVCSAERTGWGGERVNQLHKERHPAVCHSGGLERNGVKG